MSNSPGLIIAAFLSLVLLGVIASLTGALLPAIVEDLDLNPVQAGLLVSSPSVGYVIAVGVAGVLGDLLGFRRIWLLGVAVGLGALMGIAASPSFPWLLFAVASLGLVSGLLDASINPLIASMSGRASGGILNRVHLFFGIGATAVPLLVGLGLRQAVSWRWHYALASVFVLAVGVATWRAHFPPRPQHNERPPSLSSLFASPTLTLAALAIWFYGGVEAGIFSWLALFLNRERAFDPAVASLALSVFGLAMMLGRLICGRIAEPIGYRRLITGGALLGALGLTLIILLPGRVLPWFGVGLAGLALAGIFATVMADIAGRMASRAGLIAGLLCTSAGLGKIVLPWLVGQVTQITNLSAGMWLLTLCAVLTAGIYALAR